MSGGAFHDVVFPLRLALGALGGPERRTQLVSLASGREVRNALWAGSRRRWELAGAVSRVEEVAELVAFFEARGGRLHGFRFRDPLDHGSGPHGRAPEPSDQVLGTGDGVRTVFALSKSYGSYARPIALPVAGSVRVALAGAEALSGWRLEGGAVRFDEAPGPGVAVGAGFLFDVAVRFDADRLEVRSDGFGAASVVSVPLIELV